MFLFGIQKFYLVLVIQIERVGPLWVGTREISRGHVHPNTSPVLGQF